MHFVGFVMWISYW